MNARQHRSELVLRACCGSCRQKWSIAGVGEDVEKVESAGNWESGSRLWEAVWQLPRTLSTGSPCARQFILRVHPHTCRPGLIAPLLQIAQSGSTPKCTSAQMGRQSGRPHRGPLLSLPAPCPHSDKCGNVLRSASADGPMLPERAGIDSHGKS